MQNTKQQRILEIFFRSLKGENLYTKDLANEYNVSNKSISRDISELNMFFAEHRELVGNAELRYSYKDKCYQLYLDEFLTDQELFALAKVIVGTRAFSKDEILKLIEKLFRFTTKENEKKLNELLRKELYHYSEVRHDCDSIQKTLWKLVNCISDKKEISIEYYKMDRTINHYRIVPLSLMFSDYYFYMIGVKVNDENTQVRYFRVDRIRNIIEHRKRNSLKGMKFDEGELRNQSLLMFPGKTRNIRFEFSGPSVQAVLDKIPTAKIIEHNNGKYIIEAEVFGDGIKMWILSQGTWIKVLSPDEFILEIKEDLEKMISYY